MADTNLVMMLNHQTTFSEVLDVPVIISLGPTDKRMAKFTKVMFSRIATRDAKVAGSGRPGTIIFPLADAPLQDAITKILARLTAVT